MKITFLFENTDVRMWRWWKKVKRKPDIAKPRNLALKQKKTYEVDYQQYTQLKKSCGKKHAIHVIIQRMLDADDAFAYRPFFIEHIKVMVPKPKPMLRKTTTMKRKQPAMKRRTP